MSLPAWYANVAALQERYLTFVDKLIARGHELVAEAVPQIRQMVAASGDIADPAPSRVFAAVLTQLEGLERKAEQVYDEQIDEPDCEHDEDSDLVDEFKSTCAQRAEQLSKLYLRWRAQLERALEPDYQAEYQKILHDFEATRGSYRCQQCGGQLPVDRIIFIDAYVPCPQCQTQNHFAPSTLARSLERVARPFAEQRHAGLLDADDTIEQQRDALERRWYDVRMQAEDGDPNARAEVERLCAQMHHLLQQSDANMQTYLASVCRDVQAMVPDNAAHYQKLYEDALGRHRKEVADDTKDIAKMLNAARR